MNTSIESLYDRADTLFGGTGSDTLRGDANVLAVAGEYHGSDYLDGGIRRPPANDERFEDAA